ncbi:fused MFS/spermidine synthase [Diaphorobacter sp.]|uniref:fused MFS/spermidine synthase n=1 Tax=Diaphorobacter sp. TaxID=1934310 RepID=UPI0028AE2540|nr:fused MFS/spermidine synthase [Diaphorobacter sp.]
MLQAKDINTNFHWRERGIDGLLLMSFFLSGMCALMYQTSWQRILYRVIGVDTDSITIIVSVFMLGIGLGGMFGGYLADYKPHLRVKWYAAAEISIAAYGFCSLALLSGLEHILTELALESAAISAFACLVFLLIPTTLMGMTLPLLTMAFNEKRTSVGVSVGILYFVNTLGAAVGAVLVPFVLFPVLGLDHVIYMAVAGNLVVAACALVTLRIKSIHAGGVK